AILQVGRLHFLDAFQVGPDGAGEMRFLVQAGQAAVLRIDIDNVGIAGGEHRVFAVATRPRVPTGAAHRASRQVAGNTAPGTVILQAAAHGVGNLAARRYHIELLDGEVVEEPPALAAVRRHIDAAV